MLRIVLFAVAVTLFAGGASAQDKATIQKLNQIFVTAFNQGDIATVVGLYAADGYLLPPGADIIKGHRAIEAYWKQAMTQIGDGELKTIDLQSMGPGASREIGTFKFKTKTQPPQEVTGKYVVVWRKMGGQWRLATDIWNMNK